MKTRVKPYILIFVSSFFVSYIIVAVVESGTFRNYTYVREVVVFRRLGEFGSDHLVLNLNVTSSAEIPIGDTLVRALPRDVRQKFDDLGLFHISDEYNDGWRNPYHIVHEKRGGKPWIGIYSTGIDGVSRSRGNDPDDFNSWGQEGFYYQKIVDARERANFFKQTMFIGCCVSIVSLFLYELRKRRKRDSV